MTFNTRCPRRIKGARQLQIPGEHQHDIDNSSGETFRRVVPYIFCTSVAIVHSIFGKTRSEVLIDVEASETTSNWSRRETSIEFHCSFDVVLPQRSIDWIYSNDSIWLNLNEIEQVHKWYTVFLWNKENNANRCHFPIVRDDYARTNDRSLCNDTRKNDKTNVIQLMQGAFRWYETHSPCVLPQRFKPSLLSMSMNAFTALAPNASI